MLYFICAWIEGPFQASLRPLKEDNFLTLIKETLNFLRSLQSSKRMIKPIVTFASELYYEEF